MKSLQFTKTIISLNNSHTYEENNTYTIEEHNNKH